MLPMEKELIATFREEYEGGLDQLSKARYKNSIILFSKSLFALCDLLIYKKLKTLPNNHAERFRILQDYFPSAYHIVDQVFGKYTDSYTKPVLKTTCEMMKNAVKTISAHENLPAEVKEYLKKV